jgi:exopolysaccharide production protein ExoY
MRWACMAARLRRPPPVGCPDGAGVARIRPGPLLPSRGIDTPSASHPADLDVRRHPVVVAPFPRSKRALDVVAATGLLVLALPLMVGVAVAVRVDGSPVLFRQRRVGAGGRPIVVRKFRSMTADAEARLEADPVLYGRYVANGFKLPAEEDPRLTRWGRFLRSSSLDEMPQILSVLRGDMSMVGPRPVVEPELEEYATRGALDTYLGTRPGLTGLWQVSGRSALGYDERVALDITYARERSIRLDLSILARTVLVVLRRHGAH